MRKLTKSHVPPQAAGNTKDVLRASDVVFDRVRRPGTWRQGGMWVRGLCEDCNNRAGNHYDIPYADFAGQVSQLSTPFAQRLALVPGEAPPARFAPGLTARAVLYGMFAIAPRLRMLFPELAHDLAVEPTPGLGPIRWPSKLALKVARTHPSFPAAGVISSGIWSMRVLNERVVHGRFAEIVWPPLTWFLVPSDLGSEADGLGPQITAPLPDVSDWVRFGPDRTSVDLRNLVAELPAMFHPMLLPTEDWVEFLTLDGTDADAVVLFGKRP